LDASVAAERETRHGRIRPGLLCKSAVQKLSFLQMRCPFCDSEKESLQVIDSRTCEGGKAVRRRRKCLACSKRFTTYERVEQAKRLMVVKRDGRRIPWNKEKIITGLERACFKRPVPEGELLRVADEVEEEAFSAYDREIATTVVGEMVTDRLRRLDQVAYVRFASVYRQFRTLEELVDEAKAVLDARRFEDPGQGRLFLESGPPAVQGNGHPEASSVNPAPRAKRGRKPRSAQEKLEPGITEPEAS
jgi:transcriptional repressor NrdR